MKIQQKQNERRWNKTSRKQQQNQMECQMTRDWVSVVTLPGFHLKPLPMPSLRLIPHFHYLQSLLKVLIVLNHLLCLQGDFWESVRHSFSSEIFCQIVFIQPDGSNPSDNNPFNLLFITAHLQKLPAKKPGAVFNYMLAFVFSYNKEKLILAQRSSKWQNILLLLYTLCLLSFPTTELRTLYWLLVFFLTFKKKKILLLSSSYSLLIFHWFFLLIFCDWYTLPSNNHFHKLIF